MPLAFESLSHGTIAFGFFNIESDMLLLEHYFLFASDFCRHICDMAENFREDGFEARWPVYSIENSSKIGDLMGAIHGIRHIGFIGELYRKYPFPEDPGAFKQNPEGDQKQPLVRRMISNYADRILLRVAANSSALEIDIGGYKFSRGTFQEFVAYVWRGGYPRWRDDTRPGYVLDMKAKIARHPYKLFENIQFD